MTPLPHSQYESHKLIPLKNPKPGDTVQYMPKFRGWGIVDRVDPDGTVHASFSMGMFSLTCTGPSTDFRKVALKPQGPTKAGADPAV